MTSSLGGTPSNGSESVSEETLTLADIAPYGVARREYLRSEDARNDRLLVETLRQQVDVDALEPRLEALLRDVRRLSLFPVPCNRTAVITGGIDAIDFLEKEVARLRHSPDPTTGGPLLHACAQVLSEWISPSEPAGATGADGSLEDILRMVIERYRVELDLAIARYLKSSREASRAKWESIRLGELTTDAWRQGVALDCLELQQPLERLCISLSELDDQFSLRGEGLSLAWRMRCAAVPELFSPEQPECVAAFLSSQLTGDDLVTLHAALLVYQREREMVARSYPGLIRQCMTKLGRARPYGNAEGNDAPTRRWRQLAKSRDDARRQFFRDVRTIVPVSMDAALKDHLLNEMRRIDPSPDTGFGFIEDWRTY